MSYTTGAANSVTDLLTALQSACGAAGWALNGSVLSKGTCYMRVQASGGYLTVLGGRGIDGSNALTDAATALACRIGDAVKGEAITWPVTYFIHIGTAPDEVYMLIRYNVSKYQWIAFGQSPLGTLAAPATGNWFGGTANTNGASGGIRIDPTNNGSYSSKPSAAPFWINPADANTQAYATSAFDHGFEQQWCSVVAQRPVQQLLTSSPSAWNGETTLIPIRPITSRPSSLWSMVGALGHARYLRLDNLEAEQLITLGSDTWRVYPFFAKNAAARDGGDGVTHSGTLGWAIRYDGP